MKSKHHYFSKGEIILWTVSAITIIISFCIFDKENYLRLSASLIGITSLIFSAKGNPLGQLLMVTFSLLYSAVSWSFAYYGEMITYMGMTMPMSVYAFISWIKNPYNGSKSEVKINSISLAECIVMCIITAIVTAFFGIILIKLNTANIVPSTISVMTSFLAVYLSGRRSPYFALAYAANDIVLIILWLLAFKENVKYFSVIICFIVFCVNDIYGYINWQKIKLRQKANPIQETA